MDDRFELVITGGTLVSGAGRRRADVGIRTGLIAAIAEAGSLAAFGDEVIDATNLAVLPGLVDGHVHFRAPGLEAAEDWQTGSRAAVFGGVTTVLDMPNTDPPTADVASARAKAELAEANSYCDFGLIGLLAAENLDDLPGLLDAGGVAGLKVFLGPTTGGLMAPDDIGLRRGLSVAAEKGVRVAFHAEDRTLVERAEARVRASGATDALAHLASRPPGAEVAAIEHIGAMLADTGGGGHVLHLSSADGLAAVEAWRARGVDLTCEVTPHHLFLDTDDYVRMGGLVKCNPPVRGEPHASALLAALADGRIDVVGSDHAPHPPAAKAGDDIWRVAAGIAGVETALPLLLSAVAARRLTLERVVAAGAETPARLWGLARKGRLDIGADADVTIVDLERPGVIRGDGLHGKHGLTPFEGRVTAGAPVATIVRGRVLMRDAALVGGPGWGRLAC